MQRIYEETGLRRVAKAIASIMQTHWGTGRSPALVASMVVASAVATGPLCSELGRGKSVHTCRWASPHAAPLFFFFVYVRKNMFRSLQCISRGFLSVDELGLRHLVCRCIVFHRFKVSFVEKSAGKSKLEKLTIEFLNLFGTSLQLLALVGSYEFRVSFVWICENSLESWPTDRYAGVFF